MTSQYDDIHYFTKTRVSRCPMTRHWIVNYRGDRHRCGAPHHGQEEGYRRWRDALAGALEISVHRIERAREVREGR